MTGSAAVAAGQPTTVGDRRAVTVLRAVAVAGLVVDAFVHLRLAPLYDQIGTDLTQGTLFRLEAAAAIVVAVLLLLSDRRGAWLLAGLVSVAGAIAVVVTRYGQLPPFGPVPAMYDPQWTTDKVVVTVGMLATVTAWLIREALRRRSTRPS